MVCEKYAAWMTDAAVGGLALGRKIELLAHTAECDACREAYQRAREMAAFVDRGVESLVAGEPSPHFNMRLRARITDEPAPAYFNWRAWTPIAVGALALAALLVVLLSRAPQRNSSPIAGNRDEPAPGLSGTSNSSPATPKISPQPRASTTNSRHGANRALRSRPPQPEVLVPPGQLAAIMQFAAAVRTGHVDGEKLLAAQLQADAPLEIEPLEIVPLLPSQPDVALDATENPGRR